MGRQDGYTLIELMTSGVILGLAVVGTVTLWRTARDMEKHSDLRRQATLSLASTLDNPDFHYANYTTLGNRSGMRTLDSSTARPVTANLTIQVSAEDSALWGIGTSQYYVRYKTVTGTLKWSLDGESDSVVMRKRLSKVKQ